MELLFAAIASRALALPLALTGSFLFFPPTVQSFGFSWPLVGALGLVGLSNAVGAVGYRYSLYVTPSLGVQRIMLFTPVLQMLWLWVFTDVSIARPWALMLGAGVVILASSGTQTLTVSRRERM